MVLDKEFLALLACPKCRKPVALAPDETGFVCQSCALLFLIEDGIPNFLVDEARPFPA